MPGDFLRLDGTEGSQPHVQENIRRFHAFFPQAVEERGREMQPRGGRGGGAVYLGINRLIALPVRQFFVDIRGQRHLSQAGDNVLEYAVIAECDDALPFSGATLDDEGQFLRKEKLRPFARLFARFDQNLPLGEGAAL